MNEFLRKFDTIRFFAPWNIFRNFLGIFYFFEFKFKFWIWTGFIPDRTGTGPDRFDRSVWPVTGQTGPVTDGSVNPAGDTRDRSNSPVFGAVVRYAFFLGYLGRRCSPEAKVPSSTCLGSSRLSRVGGCYQPKRKPITRKPRARVRQRQEKDPAQHPADR